VLLRVNNFVSQCVNALGAKFESPLDQKVVEVMNTAIMEVSTAVETKLLRERPVPELIITGRTAMIYTSLMEWAHERFAACKRNYVESAKDPKVADREAMECLWYIRSIVQAGRTPQEESRFLK
jgi:hypothetical protein